MTQTLHITDTEDYKRLKDIHIKLTMDKDYGKAFQTYLDNLEKHNTKLPTNYEELEHVYMQFNQQYKQDHTAPTTRR